VKRIISLFLVVGLAVLLAVPAGALSLAPPDQFNWRYYCSYVDYNQDGNMELVTFGGEPQGYPGERRGYTWDDFPRHRVHTLVNGIVRTFQPTKGSQRLTGLPLSYRNSETDEAKWFCTDGFEGWSPMTVYEVTFDFQKYTYQAIAWEQDYEEWKESWELETLPESHENYGKLFRIVIKGYLLDPEYEPSKVIIFMTEILAWIENLIPIR